MSKKLLVIYALGVLTACGGDTDGESDGVTPAEPFDCNEDVLPKAPLPAAIVGEGPIPTPTGGAIADGIYQITRFEDFGGPDGIIHAETIQFRGGFFLRSSTAYGRATSVELGGFFSESGSYRIVGTTIAVERETLCSGTPRVEENWGGFSVVGNELQLLRFRDELWHMTRLGGVQIE